MANPKAKRQRDHQARLAAIQARKKKEQDRKRLIVGVLTAVVLILGVSVFVQGGGGDGTQVETAGEDTTDSTTARQPATLTSVPPGGTITGDTPCPKADGTSERVTRFAKPPPLECLNTARTYTAEVTTTKGRFTVLLDAKAAPKTVNNFVVLARYHYFDGIPFHRIIPGFVVQGGDPQASGLGDPGYKFEDELPAAGAYKVGSVAMANSSQPGTNGSQFFIITGQAGVALPPQYSLFGQVTEGLDIVKSIEAVGTAGGQPTQAITISSVTIKES